MKVCFISGSMPPIKCGIGFYSTNLLPEISRYADIHLITTTGARPAPHVSETLFTDDWKLISMPKLLSLVRSTEPDVIHIQYPAVGYKRQLGINFLVLVLRVGRVAPVIVTLHEYFGSGLLGKTRNLITILFANQLTVSNQKDLKSLPAILRKKTSLAPIGSNIPKVKPNKSSYHKIIEEAGFLDSVKPVVFFGFAFPNKGLETLIEAAEAYSLPLLMLSGLDKSNAYHAELLDKIQKANNNGAKIFVAGYLDDKTVSEVLQESDVFALPQQIPLTAKSGTAIAASTHGMIVVSKAADEPKDSLPYINNQNCVLLDNMNADVLGKTIRELIGNTAELQKMQNNALDLSEYFSWQTIAHKIHDEYERLAR